MVVGSRLRVVRCKGLLRSVRERLREAKEDSELI
jgi:hypothetical protein